MAARRHGAPILTPEMSLAEINRLPLATLKLQLDNYHLPHGGNKKTIARRLQRHLRSHPASPSVSAGASDSDPVQESSSGNTSVQESEGESSSSGTGLSSPEEGNTGGSTTPFTSAQRAALRRTVRSLMQGTGTRRQPRRTLSPPSDTQRHGRPSRRPRSTGTHRQPHKRVHCSPGPSSQRNRSPARSSKRRRFRSPSTSSARSASSHSRTSSSSTSSESDSSPHHRRRKHTHGHRHRHRSEPRRHRHHRHEPSLPAVPRKLRKHIRRGEFVVLANLLSEHLTLPGASSRGGSSMKAARTIMGLDTWMEAWSIYAGVLISYKPELAPDLFRYQSFIARSSRRFHTHAWLQYDAQFRLKLASNPGMKWSDTDPELIATWLSADASKSKPVCYTCGSPEHMSTDCPLKTSQKAPGLRCPVCNMLGHTAQHCPQLTHNKPDGGKTEEFCRLWNKRGSCFRGSKCQYVHACSDCRGSHPKSSCSQQAR